MWCYTLDMVVVVVCVGCNKGGGSGRIAMVVVERWQESGGASDDDSKLWCSRGGE